MCVCVCPKFVVVVNVNYGLSSGSLVRSLSSSYIKRRDRHLQLLLALYSTTAIFLSTPTTPSMLCCNPIMDE